eukprot:895481-Amphidinium_carterae.2
MLEGHLPELRIHSRSDILLQNNHFSCELPQNRYVIPRFSIALLGNCFTQPLNLLPEWVNRDECAALFCVARHEARDAMIKLLLAFGLLAVVLLARRGKRMRARTESPVWYARYFASKRAWLATIRLQRVHMHGGVPTYALSITVNTQTSSDSR